MKKIYCTSLNNELFDGADYATKKEAIAAMNKDLEAGDEFYVGVADPITFADVKGICGLLVDREMFWEQMEQEVGDVAEDWLNGLKKEDWEELQEIVARWIWRKDKPTFFRVKDIEKFIVKK